MTHSASAFSLYLFILILICIWYLHHSSLVSLPSKSAHIFLLTHNFYLLLISLINQYLPLSSVCITTIYDFRADHLVLHNELKYLSLAKKKMILPLSALPRVLHLGLGHYEIWHCHFSVLISHSYF